VLRRLGQGSSSAALLTERDGQIWALKVANSADHNARLEDEAETLQKLRHPHIVEWAESLVINQRTAFLPRPVFADKEK